MVVFVPAVVMLPSPATMEQIKGRPSAVVSWNIAVTTRKALAFVELPVTLASSDKGNACILKKRMHFHGEILFFYAMFRGSMKIELKEFKCLIGKRCESPTYYTIV